MNLETRILILQIHSNNLKSAKSFEEYQKAHNAYVEMLIEEYKGDLTAQNARLNFVNFSEILENERLKNDQT
jgi:hypothetical protein